MFEIGMLVGWVVLWPRPQWSALNKAGIILVFALLPAVSLVWFFAPEFRSTTLFWSVAYVAIFLGVGALTIFWRVRSEPSLANVTRAATPAWGPLVWKFLPMVAKWSGACFLLGFLLMTASTLVGGNFDLRTALLVSAPICLLPMAAALYFACVVSAADFLTARPERD